MAIILRRVASMPLLQRSVRDSGGRFWQLAASTGPSPPPLQRSEPKKSPQPSDTKGPMLIKVALKERQRPTLPQLDPADSARGRLKRAAFLRVYDYLGDFTGRLLKATLPPKALEMAQLFKTGSTALFTDMRDFAEIHNVLSSTSDWEKACGTLR